MRGFDDFLDHHRAGQSLYIPEVSQYPGRAVRELLEAQGVQSLLTTPLMMEGECLGFVGFDSVRQAREYTPTEKRLLSVFAQMLVNMRLRTQADARLQHEQQRLAEIIDGTDAGTWEWDQLNQEMVFNPRWASMLGYDSVEQLPTNSLDWKEHVHPEDFDEALGALVGHLKGQSSHMEVELRIRHREGHWIWLLLRGRVATRTTDGRARVVAGIAIDISERKALESDLQLAASVFTHSHEGILITDLAGKIVDVNRSFSRITGYSRDEVIGRNPSLLSSGRHDSGFYQRMWKTLDLSGFWSGELWNKRRDGSEYVQSLTISTVRDRSGQPIRYVGLFSDITAQKQYQQNLERMAHYDALTGLPNRVLLGERLRQAMSKTRRQGGVLAVAYVDIDHFKEINDVYGHDVGDRVLQAAAGRVRAILRETDIVARPGGDEFVALLTGMASKQDTSGTLERLMDSMSRPMQIGSTYPLLTVSIGVTFYPQDGEPEGDQLLRQADQAMYEAKRQGRNAICHFDADLERTLAERLTAAWRLRRALEDKEFELYYQPQVDLRDGRVCGVEALIRWRHPERGVLAPGQFLHLIEGDDLIRGIGHWVLSQALADLVRLRANGYGLEVSVNVSARELLRDGFVEDLKELLVLYPQLPPECVLLEFVETGMLEDIPAANRVTQRCADLGLAFALDDFGTGFSSLSHLKHLPLRQLKIDRSFVRDMLDDPDDLSIIEGVINLGRSFGLEVLAEGVETVEQRDSLLQMGCTLAQGYWIAKPMPFEQLENWLAQWSSQRRDWVAQEQLDQEQLVLLFGQSECRARLAYLARCVSKPASFNEQSRYGSSSSRFQQWLASTREGPDEALKTAYKRFEQAEGQIRRLLGAGRKAQAASALKRLQVDTEEVLALLQERLPTSSLKTRT